jgi:hypothetical protein
MPPPPAKASPVAVAATPRKFGVSSGRIVGPQRVVVYGPGGVGKSELASLAPKVVFLDLESGTKKLDVARANNVETYADVRAWLQSDECDPYETVVIDTATKLEEIGAAHVIATVPHEKSSNRIVSLQSYGFGKGLAHLYDAFTLVLQDCDRLVRRGKNVILIAHSCTSDAPNPNGDNWLRYEPRLQHPKKESSIRERVFGWADHVLFVGYDVAVNDDGKGVGGGTRTIFTSELPSHVAKTRGAFNEADVVPASKPYPKGDGSIWSLILGGVK